MILLITSFQRHDNCERLSQPFKFIICTDSLFACYTTLSQLMKRLINVQLVIFEEEMFAHLKVLSETSSDFWLLGLPFDVEN
jgi:hypothetical protein